MLSRADVLSVLLFYGADSNALIFLKEPIFATHFGPNYYSLCQRFCTHFLTQLDLLCVYLM